MYIYYEKFLFISKFNFLFLSLCVFLIMLCMQSNTTSGAAKLSGAHERNVNQTKDFQDVWYLINF